MPKVELIYDLSCPNVEGARKNLIEAFSQTRLLPEWIEWDRNSSDSPTYAREFGSPTILINGIDIAGEQPQSGNNCRIYSLNSINSGIPSVSLIVAALSGKKCTD